MSLTPADLATIQAMITQAASPWQVGAGFPDTVATVFQAGDTIINSAGVFVYSGTPAAGNLILSIASAGGTDAFTNAYKGGGVVAYGASGHATFLGVLGGVDQQVFYTGAAIEGTAANVGVSPVGSGSSEVLSMALSGPLITAHPDWAQILMQSAQQGGASGSAGYFMYIDSGGTPHIEAQWGGNGFYVTDPDTGQQSWVPRVTWQTGLQNWTSTSPIQMMSQNIGAGHTYVLEGYCNVSIGAVLCSFNVGFNFGASLAFGGPTTFHANQQQGGAAPTYRVGPTPGLLNYAPGVASANCLAWFTAVVTTGTATTVTIQMSSGTGGDTVSMQAGSYLRVQRIA